MSLGDLLADAAWVRRVAAALVRDSADADDVAQLTWVAALERPPTAPNDAGDDAKPWLATVARNLARMMGRGATRRQRRESTVAPPEFGVASPEALVERAQLQRQLATLLTELEEPYRSTVLLCYYEDLSPSEVAERLGIPAGTVRWRLKRGLTRLRARLDQLHTHRRAGWLAPMAALAPASSTTRHLSLVKGIVLMANKTMIAAGIGALAATTALVGVYEGRTLYASHHAPVELGARATAADDPSARLAGRFVALATKIPPPQAGATREELLKRDADQRAEIVRLRAELNWLQHPDPFAMPASWKHGEDFIKPPKDELLKMAKDCQVRWDSPNISVPPATMDDDFATAAGVSDDERKEFDRVSAEFTQATLAQLRSIYVEVTGDRAGADTLTPEALGNEIRAKVPTPVTQDAYWRLSQERAGLIPAATDTSNASPFERFLRLEQASGDNFESALGAAIGQQRAHQMRTEQGAWSTRMVLGNGCPVGK